MDIQHTLQECRIDAVLDTLGIQSISAKNLFKDQASRWTSHVPTLMARSNSWNSLKQKSESVWVSHLPTLLENEKTLRELDPETASESQKEDWSQILFTGELASLNCVPFALMYIAFSKIIIAPLLAWVMPIMSIILPYFALKYVYGLPIQWSDYWNMMKPMLFGTGGAIGLGNGAANAGPNITISTVLQWGSMLFSYAHGMYIPYTNAKHCYKIDQLMLKGARAVIDTVNRLRSIADTWVSCGLRKPWSLPDPSIYGDERQVVAWLVEDKHLLSQLYRAIGTVEIVAAICAEPALVPVEWRDSKVPSCKMVDAVDSLLAKEKRQPFSLVMGASAHHAICTGPNRGGKSTFLRSVLTNLIFAHTWGVSFATRCVMTPVEWVISSLRLEDSPGKESLFEREVSVAGEILKRVRARDSRGWVVIDELFHTTNPPDAATASQIFLRQLWESDMTTSIISTHMFSHAQEAPPNVQRLCVESIVGDTGKIDYTYKVCSGINTMSSVEELLVESGIMGALSFDLKTSATDLDKDAQ